jgi:hypothetical protein
MAPVAVFAIVTAKVEVPLMAIVAGEKLLVTVAGGAIVNVADAGAPLLEPCVSVTLFVGIVLT